MMREQLKGLFFCFFAVLCWSFSEITVRLLKSSSSCGPITLSFFRFFLGGLLLLGIIVIKGSLGGTWSFLKRNWVLFILSSVIALGISNMIYFIALQFVQANVGSALYTTYPIFISIYGIFILDERSSLKRKALGYTIGFFGTFILLLNVNFSLIFTPAAFGSDLFTKFSALLDLSNGKRDACRCSGAVGVVFRFRKKNIRVKSRHERFATQSLCIEQPPCLRSQFHRDLVHAFQFLRRYWLVTRALA